MPAESINALVITAAPYSETTLLLRLLTRERGVTRALAKGARRTRSTRTSAAPAAFEPFTWLEANLSQHKPDGLGTLSRAETRATWPDLPRDVARLAYAGLALELLAAVATTSPHEPFYFEEGVRFLTLLGETRAPGSLACLLCLRLLHHAGFQPRLADGVAAAHQRGELPRRFTYHFHAMQLTAAQPNDSLRDQRLSHDIVAPFCGASAESSNWFAELPPLETQLSLTTRTGPAALRWLLRIWEDHLQTRLVSVEFLEKMVLTPKP